MSTRHRRGLTPWGLTPLLLLAASAQAALVTGHIEFAQGAVAAPMTVHVIRINSEKKYQITAKDGVFQLDLEPGVYATIASGKGLQTGGRTFVVGPGLHGPRLRAYATPAPKADIGEELVALGKLDQEVRGSDKIDIDKMNAVDQANQKRLDAIIKLHGWPKESEVGYRGAQAAFFIVQHSEAAMLKRCLPLLRAAAEANELALDHLALAEDRVRMREGQPQLYGTQLRTDANGANQVWPIEDPDNLEQRRMRMGLEPHADYLAKFGIR